MAYVIVKLNPFEVVGVVESNWEVSSAMRKFGGDHYLEVPMYDPYGEE